MSMSIFALSALAALATAQQGYGYGSSSSMTPIPTGYPTPATCQCYFALEKCQTAPDANQSFCASQFSGCVGYSPYTGDDRTTKYFDNLEANCKPTSSASQPPTYSTPPPTYSSPPAAGPETCACLTKYRACQTAPDANQAFCASQFAGCINYNPFTGDSATTTFFDNLEKACKAVPSSSNTPPVYSTPVPSSSSTPPVYSTPVPTGKPTADTCACYAKLGQCQTAPDANQAYCASQFAACLGYNPYSGDSTAFFNNLKKECATAPVSPTAPVYPTSKPSYPASNPSLPPTSVAPPPKNTSMMTAPVPSGTQPAGTSPVQYTGAAPAKTAAPVLAAIAFGAMLL